MTIRAKNRVVGHPVQQNVLSNCSVYSAVYETIYIANDVGFCSILIFIGGGGGNSMPPNLSVNI